jgi:hypothetical protein
MGLQVFDCDWKSLGLKALAPYPRVDQFAVDEHAVAIEDQKDRTRPIEWITQGPPQSVS